MAEEIITETNRETATDHAYGGAQIQVLEGLEAVRKRPGMYIGSTGPSGLHHLVYEIVDNAIDEALAGYCTHIEVTIKPGNIIEVSDNGRGIPVDIQPKLGIPAVTAYIPCCTPAVSSAARIPATRWLAVCTASVRRSLMHCLSG